MTKEELEKEALAKYKTGSYPQLHPDHFAFVHGYLAGAVPREKRIEELKKENEMFKKANEIIAQQRDDRDADIRILENRIEELESQIEKMKCCGNCDNWNWKHSKCEKKLKGDCFKQSKWILRR